MTIKLIEEKLEEDLLPVVCTCDSCKNKFNVTDIGDFEVSYLQDDRDPSSGGSDSISCKCPACTGSLYPPFKKKKKLINAFRKWKAAQKVLGKQ